MDALKGESPTGDKQIIGKEEHRQWTEDAHICELAMGAPSQEQPGLCPDETAYG